MKKSNKSIDITGQKFGQLNVLFMERLPSLGLRAICECLNCGKKDVIAEPWALTSGHKKSCGCKARFKTENIIGKKFGHLEVTDMIREFRPNIGDKGKFGYFAICKCHNCGKDGFKTLKSNIKRGSTTSCGCRIDQYKSGEEHAQFTGHKGISGKHWGTIQKRSNRRGHLFDLTIEHAWDLYELQDRKCALTRLPIAFATKDTKTTASLDRIDCEIGYCKGNVQWVHKDVNIMRNVFSIDYFIAICKAVVLTSGDKNVSQIC